MTAWRIRYFSLLALGLYAASAMAAPVGTAFTYQGELKVSGVAANGPFDFEFALFNVANAGSAIDAELRNDALLTNGLFAVELDFTDAPFVAAQEYFLEVRVRDGSSSGGYTQLLPRQKITPAPYAVNARTVQAGGVDGGAIVAGAVGNTQIGNLAVTGAKIADSTISPAKLTFVPGDVTGVNAGGGLVGGGASGSLDLAVDTNAIQARLADSCPNGQYLRGVAVDGAVECESVLAFLGITLTTTVDDPPANSVGEYTDIAVGSDGLPLIAYYDTTADSLKVAKCANSACTGAATISVVDDRPPPNRVGTHPSIAFGSDGLPVISYFHAALGNLLVAECADPACSGAATITTVDSSGMLDSQGGDQNYTSIAIGGDGLPVIAYNDWLSDTLKVAKCANSACTGVATITTVDGPLDQLGYYASIAVGDDGLPVISYRGNNVGALKVAKCANAACSDLANHTITTLDGPPTNANNLAYSSIAIGSDGLPVIAYQGNNTLKVAKCVDAACTGAATITTVDDPPTVVGEYTSIAIGSDGLPAISYRDVGMASLKVAHCANAACSGANPATIATLEDTANNTGLHTSIAIGSDGLPVVSYYDDTTKTLRVAKCATPSCQ